MAEDDADDLVQSDEHDVVVHLKMSNRSMGTAKERLDITMLAEQLGEAVLDAKVGEYDGDEYGGGECLLFFAGPNADQLYAVLHSILRTHQLGRGAMVQLQYGSGEPITKRI
ncbi:MAG: hypothetical protein NT107_07145 [Planctomycetota bacterium]|jgi:hypothetical protein|nr:hypothetical protein [Planctomycetota bacterium]